MHEFQEFLIDIQSYYEIMESQARQGAVQNIVLHGVYYMFGGL